MSIHEFIPGAFDPVTVDGQIYAIPWIADYRVLLLNVDRWEEVGIDVFITEDWNWSMFLETAQKLTRYGADGEPVQTGYAADASRWTWLPWLFSNGGSFFNEDETAAAFNTEAGREALEFLNQLYTVDVMHPELTGRPNFLAGRAAMFHTYPGEDNHVLTSAPDMNVWYAMIPQGPSGFGPVTDMNINYRAIPATTQNPDLAWEYLKWYHTARTVKYEIMGSHRSPWVPFYESAEWVYSLDDYPHRATIPEFMQKTKFDPVKELSAWSGEVNHLISAAIRGELDPGNALEQAEQIVNAALSAR